MVTLFEKVSFRGTPSISLSVFFGILLARQQDLQPPDPRQLRDTRPLTINFFKVYFYNRVRCTPDGSLGSLGALRKQPDFCLPPTLQNKGLSL